MQANYGRAARLLSQLPRDCRVWVAVEPSLRWSWNEVLLNKASYLLELVVWQNGTPSKKAEKAKHEANKPKFFLPEFMKSANEKIGLAKDTVAADTDTIKELLSRPRV